MEMHVHVPKQDMLSDFTFKNCNLVQLFLLNKYKPQF